MKELEVIRLAKGKKFLFKVETSRNQDDYRKYEELRYKIWEDPDDNLAGTRNMICENYFNDGNFLFIGAYVEDEHGRFNLDTEHMAGFSYGFVGVENKEIGFRALDNLLFYSQYTGVRKDFFNYGLGILIKDFQKKILLEVFGIYTVTCTYDPLTGVNAYRNIHRFGMEVIKYREAYYDGFSNKLNRADVPCDRLCLSWDLKREVQKPLYTLERLVDKGHLAISSDIWEVKGRSGPVKLEVVSRINLELNKEFLLVEIPVDFYNMLIETDVVDDKVRRIPLDWRMESRRVFQTFMGRGYKVIDFRYIQEKGRRRDFYVLGKMGTVPILRGKNLELET